MTAILDRFSLGHVWTTVDPFLFCVHHLDHYPEGDGRMGPKASLRGRNMGQDFGGKDGWSMYHGMHVPGFPAHPHRGFETVTVVLRGLVDHFDSSGATGRYGEGDVQWMTAGSGLQHSEMFPLVDTEGPNTLDLFQIWLNLPAADKMTEPGYTMLWAPSIPVLNLDGVNIRVIAGTWGEAMAPAPPAASWAADPSHRVGIVVLTLEAGARVDLPVDDGVERCLYHVDGASAVVDGVDLGPRTGLHLDPAQPVRVEAQDAPVRLLMLQGQPIREPVAQHGPFVMNDRMGIVQAFEDYQRTRFGGWSWGAPDVVHPPEQGRFAQYADGTVEHPDA